MESGMINRKKLERVSHLAWGAITPPRSGRHQFRKVSRRLSMVHSYVFLAIT